jgi:hypothetical protein
MKIFWKLLLFIFLFNFDHSIAQQHNYHIRYDTAYGYIVSSASYRERMDQLQGMDYPVFISANTWIIYRAGFRITEWEGGDRHAMGHTIRLQSWDRRSFSVKDNGFIPVSDKPLSNCNMEDWWTESKKLSMYWDSVLTK